MDNPPEGLTQTTIRSYLGCVRRVRRQFEGLPLIKIICMGTHAIKRVESNAVAQGITLNTLKADLGAVKSAAKHVMSNTQKELIQHYLVNWGAAHKAIQEQAVASFENNKANTEKQSNGFVQYEDLCKARDALPYADPMRLWLALSTMIPCARAGDYAECRLLFEEPASSYSFLADYAGNYCVVTRSVQYIHLRIFKTSKHYPVGIKMAMPRCLVLELAHNLKSKRRHFMFVMADGKPYTLRSSFSNYVDRRLKTILRNPDTTAQLVRRAYVTHSHAVLRPSLLSEELGKAAWAREKLAALAHCCGHKLSTHQKYVLELDDAGKPELLEIAHGVAAACTCRLQSCLL